jgi:hypothetical protein
MSLWHRGRILTSRKRRVIRGSARGLLRQAIAGGEVADLRAQIAFLAFEATLGAFLGYQFDAKALDQRGDRSLLLCGLGPDSPAGLIVH